MTSLCTGNSAYYDDLRLAFRVPVSSLKDSVQAEIINLKDSTVSHCDILLDSNGMTARLVTSLRSGENYSVRIADSLYADLYGHPTDSLVFTLSPKDYGILMLHIDNLMGHPLIVEVLDSRDTVVQHKPLDGTDLRFDHLPAGEYHLRAVVDCDSNGQWTPGDYQQNRQPEECIYYEKTLQLREKWELEERWTVGASSKLKERKTLKGTPRVQSEVLTLPQH